MSQSAAALKWGVERRLEFIEFRLFWEGGVNRADIIQMFDVSVPQASKDLTLYQERAPNNAIYDKSAKRYVAGDHFQPCFLKPDPAAYLNQLRSVSEGILDRSHAWIGKSLPYEAAPTPVRGVSAQILRSVISAIRQSQAIEVRYQSLSRPDPRWRWLAPHAIGFDGFRWHARAYCETDRMFKDFLLSRMLEMRDTRPSGVAPDIDADWHELVTIEIGPPPRAFRDAEEGHRPRLRDARRQGENPCAEGAALLCAEAPWPRHRPGRASPQDQQIVLLNQEPQLAVVGAMAVEG